MQNIIIFAGTKIIFIRTMQSNVIFSEINRHIRITYLNKDNVNANRTYKHKKSNKRSRNLL